jgi:hypothetical protein
LRFGLVWSALLCFAARTTRLREAEQEANRAMEEERQRLEKELKNDPELVDASYDAFAKALEEETRREIDKIKKAYETNKGMCRRFRSRSVRAYAVCYVCFLLYARDSLVTE